MFGITELLKDEVSESQIVQNAQDFVQALPELEFERLQEVVSGMMNGDGLDSAADSIVLGHLLYAGILAVQTEPVCA